MSEDMSQDNDSQEKRKKPLGDDPGKPKESNSIDMLRRQLYSREQSPELKRRVEALSKPPSPEELQSKAQKSEKEPELVDVMRGRVDRRRKLTRWSIVVAVAAALLIGGAVVAMQYRSSRQVTEEQIGIEVTAPTDFTAGEEIIYTIEYENNSRVKWLGVEVMFEAPPGFIYASSEPAMEQAGNNKYRLAVGDLSVGQKGEVVVRGQMLGEAGSSMLARVEVSLSPENWDRGRFARSETVTTAIVSVPFEVSIEAAGEAADGERMLAVVRVRNTSSQPLPGALLRLLPVDGLLLVPDDAEFSPQFSVLDGWWELGRLEPFEEVTRKAVLVASGQPTERRNLEAQVLVRLQEQIYPQRTVAHVVTISESELLVDQQLNGQSEAFVVAAGERMEGVVEYSNTGNLGLSNLVVKVAFEGEGLDASKIELQSGGAYDPVTKTITWTTASVPELATLQPGQHGTLDYRFAILPTSGFPATDESKNQALTVVATVDSPDLPTPTGQDDKAVSDRMSLPISTSLAIAADAFYDDGRLGLKSEGPLPPKVGERTTYTVRLRLGSTLNDVGDVQVRSVLQEGIEYSDNVYKTTGEVEFSERTREVLWRIPQVAGLTGRASPPAELHFQIAITPGENLLGKTVAFLNSVQVEALDLYTDKTVTATLDILPRTDTADRDNGEVE